MLESILVTIEQRGGGGARKRRRKEAAAAERPHVKTSVRFSAVAYKRLRHYCVEAGRTQAEVLEELVMSQLGRYVVQDRGKSGPSPQPEGEGSGPPELRAVG